MNFNNYLSILDRQKLIKIGAPIAAALLFLAFVLYPMLGKSGELDRKLGKARKDLAEMTRLADRYMALSARRPSGFGKGKLSGGSLTSEVENIARTIGTREYIKKMAPKRKGERKGSEELYLSLSGLPLSSLVEFLEKLYNSPAGVSVKRASLKPYFEDRNLLEVELTLEKGF